MTSDPKDFFASMAERIARNSADEFGGAMLIVPPTGDPIEYLFITANPKNEESFFWAQCKSKLDLTAVERMEAQTKDPWARQR